MSYLSHTGDRSRFNGCQGLRARTNSVFVGAGGELELVALGMPLHAVHWGAVSRFDGGHELFAFSVCANTAQSVWHISAKVQNAGSGRQSADVSEMVTGVAVGHSHTGKLQIVPCQHLRDWGAYPGSSTQC